MPEGALHFQRGGSLAGRHVSKPNCPRPFKRRESDNVAGVVIVIARTRMRRELL